jgi:hypothetical protein
LKDENGLVISAMKNVRLSLRLNEVLEEVARLSLGGPEKGIAVAEPGYALVAKQLRHA